MNQDRDNNLPSAERDPLVSAEYRATATERTSPALDAMVLEKARAAAKNSRLRGFTAFWFRPLAFIATLGLSLALVLELTKTPELQSLMDTEADVGRRAPQPFETVPADAADSLTTEFHRPVDSPARMERPDAKSDAGSGKPQPPASAQDLNLNDDAGGRNRSKLTAAPTNAVITKQAPVPANAPGGDERASAGIAEMPETSSKRMQETDSVTEYAIQSLRQTRAAGKPQIEEVAALRVSDVVPDTTASSCAEQQVADSMTWWQCITQLKEAGRDDEAKVELDLFNAAYPDFQPPDAP